jgi:hypothetical protein
LQAESERLKTDLARASELAASAQAERTAHEETIGRLAGVQSEVSRLQAELAELSNLRAENERLQADLSRASGFEASVEGERAAHDKAASELAAAQSKVTKLEAELARISDLQAENERVKAEFSRASQLAASAQSERTGRERAIQELAAAQSEVSRLKVDVARMSERASTESLGRGRAEEALTKLKAEMKRVTAQAAVQREQASAMEAAARAERERADRLSAQANRILDDSAAGGGAATDRIAELERKLAVAKETEDHLRIACDGYLARIGELTSRGWLAVGPLLRPTGTKLRFSGVPGLKGLLDKVDRNGIGGWACWPERPTERVQLAFYDGERFLGTQTADRMRRDLIKNGIGDGRFAFYLPLPQTIADGKPHRLDVRLAATAQSVLARPIEFTMPTPPAKRPRPNGNPD